MMKRKRLLLLVVISLITFSFGNVPVASSQPPQPMLKMVTIEAGSSAEVKKLARMGVDITALRKGPVVEGPRGVPVQTYQVEGVVSALEEKKLDSQRFSWSEKPGRGPVKKIGEPYDVYHSFDEPKNGIKDQLHKIAATYPHVAQLNTIGQSIERRPLLAMRLTSEKTGGDKPQVLFLATHHAREWVATEMAMRLIKYLASNYGLDGRVTDLLDTVEVWVVPVANPDGYQFTFTNERLWRKNLRDNDGDGQITLVDGVDINRNFDYHWGYDDEGSTSLWSADDYRGAAPNSEPETRAVVDFVQSQDFKFIVSYHTYGDWILYPWGWQWNTPSFDDPIYVAQSGTDDNPAIWDSILGHGYDPGVGAELYTTNGDFNDWSYGVLGIPSYTVELTDEYDFTFPDDEAMVQTVFEDNLDFALAMAESALDPAHPVSLVGIATEDVYHTPVTASYGSEQIIEVLARRGLDLRLLYQINDGEVQETKFNDELGTIYNDRPGGYYSKYQATIGGQQAGDQVSYGVAWNGYEHYTPTYDYEVVSATGHPILVVAAEDYSGSSPTYHPGNRPHYLEYYTQALDAAGYTYDVWDVDAHAAAPSYAEVLSHYDVAIWYTGDDWIPTVPDLDVHGEEVVNFREFINYDGGRLFATGQDLAYPSLFYAQDLGLSDDFFQYYLGAYMHTEEGGMNPATGLPYDIRGEAGDPIFDGLTFSLYSKKGANNQAYADTFLAIEYFLPGFDGEVAARYVRPGGPFDPHSGTYYVYSQMADMAYKRLGGTFTIPADSPSLKFWISYDIEPDWDYAFVEISEVGTDVWTTLPDVNGLTTTSTGESCPEGWVDEVHPFLAHYMDAACNPTGTTGAWNAFTGNSGGWHQVEMDLSAFAGKTVELYISYASDWSVQALGAFVDDIELSGYPLEDFEAGTGNWSASVAPGSTAFNNWARITATGFPEGPAIRTSGTVYFGFGFEAIDTAANRAAVMNQVMKYLGQ
jgi:hypothetical protein